MQVNCYIIMMSVSAGDIPHTTGFEHLQALTYSESVA